MLRLLAFYDDRQLDRQFLLLANDSRVLGRGDSADFCADWDSRISREHLRLDVTDEAVHVSRLDNSSNPVFIDGNEVQSSELRPGQSFVIGDSRFELRQVTQSDSPRGSGGQQLAIDRRQLQKIRYEDADKRIEVLTSLPTVIRESGVKRDLHIALSGLLLAGIQHADGTAIVSLDDNKKARVLHQERRFEANGHLQPSSRMIQNAIDQQKSILHVWDETVSTERASAYTQQAEFNWAFAHRSFLMLYKTESSMWLVTVRSMEPKQTANVCMPTSNSRSSSPKSSAHCKDNRIWNDSRQDCDNSFPRPFWRLLARIWIHRCWNLGNATSRCCFATCEDSAIAQKNKPTI
jgi:hypothetical protein